MNAFSRVLCGFAVFGLSLYGIYFSLLLNTGELPGRGPLGSRRVGTWDGAPPGGGDGNRRARTRTSGREHGHAFRSLRPEKRAELLSKWRQQHF